MNEKMLEILADDMADNTVYTLHMRDRETDLNLDCGVFRHFSTLKKACENRIEFEEHANDDSYCAADFEWCEIKKYIMVDDELEQKMSAKISFDFKLLHYSIIDDAIDRTALLEYTVAPIYETGDIIKVKNMPLSDDFYIIYIYDETQEGNKHIQMTFDEGPEFCKLYWLETTEKVMISPDNRINDMSAKIKQINGDFSKVFEDNGIKMEIHPF